MSDIDPLNAEIIEVAKSLVTACIAEDLETATAILLSEPADRRLAFALASLAASAVGAFAMATNNDPQILWSRVMIREALN